MQYDIHCHTDKLSTKEIELAIKNSWIIGAVSTNLKSCKKNLALKEKYPKNIKLFFGIHPEYKNNFNEVREIIQLIKQNRDKISGIGEIGIPFFYLENKTLEEKIEIKKRSLKLLTMFLETASHFNLPVNLHVVSKDIYLVLPLLKEFNIKKALFHWYEGSEKELTLLSKYNHFISASPEILVNKNYFEFVKKIPLDMLLLESDGPWEYSGKRGIPKMTLDSASLISKFHKISVEKLLLIVENNFIEYFR